MDELQFLRQGAQKRRLGTLKVSIVSSLSLL